ncbi:MAG TPA: hypothetical protein VGH37_08790 [Candidatus Acidoferrum sp.]
MKKETRIVLNVVAILVLVAAVQILPAKPFHSTAAPEQEATQTQSVSGKIATVGKTSFTLTLEATPSSRQGQQLQEAMPKSMTFQIDKNTTIDGKMKVGANADVTYREDSGKYIAINVRVS